MTLTRTACSFCDIFFNEVASTNLCRGTSVASRNVRGGTTLHELTHATSGTSDVGYGCSYDMSLGSSSPSSAVRNADNYNVRLVAIFLRELFAECGTQCFATQVYQNTQC